MSAQPQDATTKKDDVTPREIHYFWGKVSAVIGVLLICAVLIFFLGIYADEAVAGDPLFDVDTWMEKIVGTFSFTQKAKRNHAIAVTRERLQELLTIDQNDKERTLLGMYELDKSLVSLINTLDPSEEEVIQNLQQERESIATLMALLQGVYPSGALAQNKPTPSEANPDNITPTPEPGSSITDAQVHDVFENVETSIIHSLNKTEDAVNTTQAQKTPLPTNTPIPTPTMPTIPTPTPTSAPKPTATPTLTPTPTVNLGQGQEIEFTGVLANNAGTYTMNDGSTTYTVLNGSTYAQYVGQSLHVHALLYSGNKITLTEIDTD